jgi:hypothetical protein
MDTLFDLTEEIPALKRDWQNEWVDMPEYNNSGTITPLLTATFKFRTEEDFNIFMEVVKRELYDDKRVFDGKQLKTEKSAWFPLDERPSENVYVVKKQVKTNIQYSFLLKTDLKAERP